MKKNSLTSFSSTFVTLRALDSTLVTYKVDTWLSVRGAGGASPTCQKSGAGCEVTFRRAGGVRWQVQVARGDLCFYR